MIVTTNGIELYVKIQGNPKADVSEPLVFLHGMTLNGRDWEPVVQALANGLTLVTVDLLGHGRSQVPESPEHYGIEAVVEQVRVMIKELGLGCARWVGYSMGGRILLQLAVRHPDLIESMILESTTPGIESEERRKKRRRKDNKLAKYLESRGLEAFVDRWMSAPMFESQQSVSAKRRERARQLRLQNDPEGLKNCLRELGRGKVPHVWNDLDQLTMPVKLITGDLDDKHRKIHERMHGKLPNSSVTVIDGVGHNVHFEDPETFVEECVKFWKGNSGG